MLGYSVGNLVAEDDSQGRLVLRHRKETGVDDNLSAGHAEGVDLIVLHKVELPLEVVDLVGIAVILQVVLYGVSQPLTHALDHSRLSGVGGELCRRHIFSVLLVGECENLTVADRQAVLAAGDWYC